MSNLKPCPFCGGEAEVKRHAEISTAYYVACTNCPVDVGRMWYWKRQDAINAWNRRTTETDTPCGAWKACWDSIKEAQKGADNENA